MFKLFLTSAALSALLTGATIAADLYEPAAPMPIVSNTSAYNWSGFYVGAVAGGGIFSSDVSDYWCNFACDGPDLSDGGFTLGGTAGFNWQFGAGVVGIEADASWANLENEYTVSVPDYTVEQNAHWDWLATVRARAGLAVDRALIFATAGVAIVDASYSSEYTAGCDPNFYCLAEADEVQVGLAVGAGAEYALGTNARIKLDYLYVGLPDADDTNEDAVGGCSEGECPVVWKSDAHLVRAGLNWRF